MVLVTPSMEHSLLESQVVWSLQYSLPWITPSNKDTARRYDPTRRSPILIMMINDLFVRATVVLHFLNDKMLTMIITRFATIAKRPIVQERLFSASPSSSSFEHSSLHSSDESKQSILPSHLLVLVCNVQKSYT